MSDNVDERGRDLTIRTVAPGDAEPIRQMAVLLVDGFRDFWPDAWPDRASAEAEVREALAADKVCLAAYDGEGRVAGWIGGQPQYDGRVWELHPMVVRADLRGRGIGRALVDALEARVRAAGGITLWLGTDDEAGLTSLGGIDLYPGVVEKLRSVDSDPRHPLGFYRRLGFEVVGVMPDANGTGKPDIFMAKRIGAGDGGA